MSIIKNKLENNSKSYIRYFFTLSLLFVLFGLNNSIKAEEISAESYDSDSTNIIYVNSFQLKTESHAFKESFWGTVGPLPTIVFAVPGFVFGPSLGYFYAEKPGRAWVGIGIRTIGVLAFAGAYLDETVITDCFECGYYNDDSTNDIIMAVSASVIIISAVYDIATVKKTMRKKKASMLQSNFNIEPSYFADTKTYGFKLSLRF